MARYRKKPVEIEAEEFTGEHIEGCNTSYDDTEDYYKVYNKLHDSWIKVGLGDMIRTDLAPDDVYPIDKDTFAKTYEFLD